MFLATASIFALSACDRTPAPQSDVPRVDVSVDVPETVPVIAEAELEMEWAESVVFPAVSGTLAVENRKGNAINANEDRILVSSQVAEPICGWGVNTPAILFPAANLDIHPGETLRLKVQAKKTRDVPHRMALCYTTNGVGSTGWMEYELSAGLTEHVLDFTYPENRSSLEATNDFFAIWADTDGDGKAVEIRNITLMKPKG